MGLFQSLFGPRAGGSIAGVNAEQLNDLIKNGGDDLLLIDVRSRSEYVHDGHIEGTVLMPLQELFHRAGELPMDKELVLICRSGNRSMVACQQLAQMGFSNIKNFNGGMISWVMAGLPVSH